MSVWVLTCDNSEDGTTVLGIYTNLAFAVRELYRFMVTIDSLYFEVSRVIHANWITPTCYNVTTKELDWDVPANYYYIDKVTLDDIMC